MADSTPAWGIEPVPERLRVLGFLDVTLLWGSLGVSLLVIVIGGFLVPALSLRDALVAVLVGGVVGNAMLGLAGMIGADARVPGMVLMRAPLGQVGSYGPTALNVLQCLGWATFELIVIAVAAAALSDELFGVEARWAWTLIFGTVAAALALMGPVSVVRRFLRRFGVWIVLASLVYLSWWALAEADLADLWGRSGEGGSSVWIGIDLVVAITVSWVPLAADYTRFAQRRRSAGLATGLGYFVAGTWMLVLGVLLVLSRDLGDIAELPAAVAAAGITAALALLAITVDETDEAFANIYSTAVSLQNLAPRVPQRALILGVSALATLTALAIELRNYESFLLLLGSFFVPLFGVLLADWLLSGRHYIPSDVFEGPAFRPGPVAAWVAGFVIYHALHDPPLGPAWWTRRVEDLDPIAFDYGASLPSFAAAFVLAASFGAIRRVGRSRTSPQLRSGSRRPPSPT